VLFQIKQDSSSFENGKAIARLVDENWDTTIWIQFDKPRLFLFIFAKVYFVDTIWMSATNPQ
jgi:hypothetical protein